MQRLNVSVIWIIYISLKKKIDLKNYDFYNLAQR